MVAEGIHSENGFMDFKKNNAAGTTEFGIPHRHVVQARRKAARGGEYVHDHGQRRIACFQHSRDSAHPRVPPARALRASRGKLSPPAAGDEAQLSPRLRASRGQLSPPAAGEEARLSPRLGRRACGTATRRTEPAYAVQGYEKLE